LLQELRKQYPDSRLLEYIEKCKSGEIIIGHELMQQLDMLLEHFDDPDIKIDFADAIKRIRFIEEKCKHSEAPYAGKPFILMLNQKAFIESIYIFLIYDDELQMTVRKYQEVLFLVSRKGGKTPLISALCLAEFFCGEIGTKILCSSNDYDQADLAFQAIDAMREQSSSLEKLTRKNIKGIFFGNPKKPKKKGKFSYANKGNIRKISAKTGAKEGKNIRVGMSDEVHELKDDSAVMPIRQALSTQNNPLYFDLTTEGFTNDGYLDHRLKEARQVLAGELERPRWLIWLYTQDSETEIWQDEKTWVKSNPGLGVIKKWSFLRGMVEEAKTNMATRVFVLAKDFNIKQNASNAAFSPELYTCPETFDPNDLKGCFGIGSVDLAMSIDLASARIMLMRPGDSRKYFLQRYFIPEDKLDAKDDGKDYHKWKQQGLITVSSGATNDFDLITKWFIEIVNLYKIRMYKIGYDEALAKYWIKSMSEIFDDVDQECMTRVPQKREALSAPFSLLESDLRNKLIVTNNNPIDEWCLSNVGIDIDKRGLILPVRAGGNKEKKIDGAATLINCEYIYLQNRSEFMAYVNS
jgi:phage terminase large subunit-like protein